MAKNEVDLIDLAGIVLFPVAASVVFGVFSLSLDVFGGFDFTQVLWSAEGIEVTAATVLAASSLLWVVGTNEIDGSEYDDFEYAIIAFAFLSVPLYEFIPSFASLVQSHDILAVILWAMASVATAYVAYTE